MLHHKDPLKSLRNQNVNYLDRCCLLNTNITGIFENGSMVINISVDDQGILSPRQPLRKCLRTCRLPDTKTSCSLEI